uniref:Uncharacterized protein n=1 Tax=Oryza brachyantha TaxID=4533 RepID=J3KZV2_ORYBR
MASTLSPGVQFTGVATLCLAVGSMSVDHNIHTYTLTNLSFSRRKQPLQLCQQCCYLLTVILCPRCCLQIHQARQDSSLTTGQTARRHRTCLGDEYVALEMEAGEERERWRK